MQVLSLAGLGHASSNYLVSGSLMLLVFPVPRDVCTWPMDPRESQGAFKAPQSQNCFHNKAEMQSASHR